MMTHKALLWRPVGFFPSPLEWHVCRNTAAGERGAQGDKLRREGVKQNDTIHVNLSLCPHYKPDSM